MQTIVYRTALIVGAGMGLSASLTRLFSSKGMRVALAARQADKLAALCSETGATAYACDAANVDDVARLFTEVERDHGAPDVVVYNASARVRGAHLWIWPPPTCRKPSPSAPLAAFLWHKKRYAACFPMVMAPFFSPALPQA